MRYLKLYLLSALALFFLACSDDDDGTEFKFDREIYEYSIIEGCGPGAPEDSICYKIRYHYPIRTEDYSGLTMPSSTILRNLFRTSRLKKLMTISTILFSANIRKRVANTIRLILRNPLPNSSRWVMIAFRL